MDAASELALERIAGWVRAAGRVVALTGAGISTDSGIPDFRGPQGLWTRDPAAERLSHIGPYLADPEVRRRAWRARLEHPAWHARPNAAHRALVELERVGRLHTLVTQNIDGLHETAGTSPEILIEVHGTIREVVCLSCGWRGPMNETLDRVRAGEDDPACKDCGGILKSATVSFGQPLNPVDLGRALGEAERADVLLAIGTSLSVYPVAHMPARTLQAGGRVAILNAEPTPLDPVAHAVVRAPLGYSLPRLVELVRDGA